MAPVLPLLILAGVAGYILVMGKKSGGDLGTGQTDPNNPGAHGSPLPPLTADEIKLAVQTALNVETDPVKLNEFAESLLPDQAAYGQKLHDRAAMLAGVPPIPVVNPGGGGIIIPEPRPQPQPVPSPILPPVPQPQPLPSPQPTPEPVPVPNPDPTPHINFPDPGSTAYVVTHDTGPSGSLNVRDLPSTSGQIITKVGHGTGVTIIGAPTADGWFPVRSPLGREGYASGQYLGATPPADGIDPSGWTGQEVPIGPSGQGNEIVSHS